MLLATLPTTFPSDVTIPPEVLGMDTGVLTEEAPDAVRILTSSRIMVRATVRAEESAPLAYQISAVVRASHGVIIDHTRLGRLLTILLGRETEAEASTLPREDVARPHTGVISEGGPCVVTGHITFTVEVLTTVQHRVGSSVRITLCLAVASVRAVRAHMGEIVIGAMQTPSSVTT